MNDPSILIKTTTKQIIIEAQVQDSPRVVSRTFDVSTFRYEPRFKESTFMLFMDLEPTVDIAPANDITIKLPGFKNVLMKQYIHHTGVSSSFCCRL